MKILLAEDYEHTRKTTVYGLKNLIKNAEIFEAENGLAAINAIKSHLDIEVVLMDISMPVMNGIDAAKQIKELKPDIKIIMLTSFSEEKVVFSSFQSGANAYCLKTIKTQELVNAINSVLNGAIWIDPSIAQYILQIFRSDDLNSAVKEKNANNFDLTARERDILKHISLGKSNKEIAEELFLSIHTVKNHLKSILQKLSVQDRTQAAIMAIKENLV